MSTYDLPASEWAEDETVCPVCKGDGYSDEEQQVCPCCKGEGVWS